MSEEIKTTDNSSLSGKKPSAKKIAVNMVPFLKVLCIVIMALTGIGALVFFILCMSIPDKILSYLLTQQVGIYANNLSATSAGLIEALLSRPFSASFTAGYIRTVGLFVLLLAIPVVCAVFNIFFLINNASSRNPFKKSTSSYIKTSAYCFAGEFLLSTVLFTILKLINQAIPYYMCYAMVGIALLSAVLFMVLMSFNALIDRMKALANSSRRQAPPNKD